MMANQTFTHFLRREGCTEETAAASVRLVRAYVAFVHGRTNGWPQFASKEDVDAFLEFITQGDPPVSYPWGRLLTYKRCLHTLGAYFRYLHREDLAFHTCMLWEGVKI